MKRLLLLASLLLASGCYRTTVRSGHPPSDSTVETEDQWHHAFALGLIEHKGGHDLSRRCPGGWAEVRSKTGPLQTFLGVVTLGIYTPQTVSLICAEPGVAAAAPAAGYDPPPASAKKPFPPRPPEPAPL